ncbi:TPR repeat-containing protein [Calothrix sp. PCC 7716]|nr:TPR repeat-containing protein [Calothrix sp. PCC 7716]
MVISYINYEQEAELFFLDGDYMQAISLYEKAISQEPEVLSYYCKIGLALLLNGQELEAQISWMMPISNAKLKNTNSYINELIEILEAEALRQEALTNYTLAWAIRQHMREIKYNNINNLFKICLLANEINISVGDTIVELNLCEALASENILNLNENFLYLLLENILKLEPLHSVVIEFAKLCLKHITNLVNYLYIIQSNALEIGYTLHQPTIASKLLENYLQIEPNNLEVLRLLTAFYQDARDYQRGIETAKQCYLLSENIAEKIASCHLILRGFLKAGGYWKEVCLACKDLELALSKLVVEQPKLNEVQALRLMTQAFSVPHIKDKPHEFRAVHNQVAKIFQTNIKAVANEQATKYIQRNSKHKNHYDISKPLKIGYLSYCLRQHSVGWLTRGLFQHHDRTNFQINVYFINYMLGNDGLQEWYSAKADKAVRLGMNGLEAAEKIYEDEVDILIDLDSITLDISCEVIALKPAPVQVTWLGWDASGIPTVDYFIGDPYVLPDTAQKYYTEKIWRLPNTYIAVDGFEVGIPTLRRSNLGIPSDAIVYLSAQRGYKRHPETTRLQMKIIQEVPNSYFLIKGSAEEEAIKNFFYKIAEQEGVDCSRLRFLPQDASESIHRANLGIADVVLDTYPYNGATTTLETLWMGIPLVTRVGEQFAARNSYTMMINAGITEGIAWTDEEYIEWGIRLGKDANLRQQVAWKLRQSRHTAPLWNAKQFTREMEKAYQQMWQIYLEGH